MPRASIVVRQGLASGRALDNQGSDPVSLPHLFSVTPVGGMMPTRPKSTNFGQV